MRSRDRRKFTRVLVLWVLWGELSNRAPGQIVSVEFVGLVQRYGRPKGLTCTKDTLRAGRPVLWSLVFCAQSSTVIVRYFSLLPLTQLSDMHGIITTISTKWGVSTRNSSFDREADIRIEIVLQSQLRDAPPKRETLHCDQIH